MSPLAISTYNVRTGRGIVHRMTVGRTYRIYGELSTNQSDSVCGKADCGALTSSAAKHTDRAVTCVNCLAA